jgi:DNA processing protein
VVYPRANKNLYSQISRKGLLVSEYTLGTRPEGFRFPARNRIIAGVSSGVVVVEAAKKSGSLITVQFALEEGREVFAVPGQIDSVKSGGTHWLLQQGAGLVVSADDIISSLRLQVGGQSMKNGARSKSVLPDLDAVSLELLSVINSYPIQRDELVGISGLAPARLSEHLLLLELEGLVELLPGDEVCRLS